MTVVENESTNTESKHSYQDLVKEYFRDNIDKKKPSFPLLKTTDISYKQGLVKVWQLLNAYLEDNDKTENRSYKIKSIQKATGTVKLKQEFFKKQQSTSLAVIDENEENTTNEKPINGNNSINKNNTISEKIQSIRNTVSKRMNLSNVFGIENNTIAEEAESENKEKVLYEKVSEDGSKNKIPSQNVANNIKKHDVVLNIEENLDDVFELTNPLDQIQYITGYAILYPEARDEVYCMLYKAINEGDKKAKKSWKLLYLLMSVCVPSDGMKFYLENLISERNQPNLEEFKELFTKCSERGPRFQPPSSIEIESLEKNQPLEINVTTMDKSMHTIQAHPCITSSEVVTDVMTRLQIKETFGFSLFITLGRQVMSLGWGNDKVFDAIARCEQIEREKQMRHNGDFKKDGLATVTENIIKKFNLKQNSNSVSKDNEALSTSGLEKNKETDGVLLPEWKLFIRKEVFLPWDDDVINDSLATHLCYVQLCRSLMLGECAYDKGYEVAAIAARQYYVEYGEDVTEEGMQEVVENFIPASWISKNQGSVYDWTQSVMKLYDVFFNEEPLPSREFIKAEIVLIAKEKWYSHFSRHFESRRLEGMKFGNHKRVLLSINSEGVSILSRKNGLILHHAEFYRISSVSSSNLRSKETDSNHNYSGQSAALIQTIRNVVTFILLDGNVIKLFCKDAAEVVSLVKMFHSGLTERSIWALAKHTKSYEGLETIEGDLLRLSKGSKEALSCQKCHCGNMSTGLSGDIDSDDILVIQTIDEPNDDLLKLFRPSAYNRKRLVPTEAKRAMQDGINNKLIINNDNINEIFDTMSSKSVDNYNALSEEEAPNIVINNGYESTCV